MSLHNIFIILMQGASRLCERNRSRTCDGSRLLSGSYSRFSSVLFSSLLLASLPFSPLRFASLLFSALLFSSAERESHNSWTEGEDLAVTDRKDVQVRWEVETTTKTLSESLADQPSHLYKLNLLAPHRHA